MIAKLEVGVSCTSSRFPIGDGIGRLRCFDREVQTDGGQSGSTSLRGVERRNHRTMSRSACFPLRFLG